MILTVSNGVDEAITDHWLTYHGPEMYVRQ